MTPPSPTTKHLAEAPSPEKVRDFAEAFGRNAPARLRKLFPTYSPAALVALLTQHAPGWDARAKVHHELQAVPKPIGKGAKPKAGGGE